MNRRPPAVWLLIALQFLLGLGALAGGGMLIAAPDGSRLGMPLSMLQYSPFRDFLIPGLILFTVLGVFPVFVAYSLWQRPAWRWLEALNPARRKHWSWAASLFAGIILLLWITFQVLLIRSIVLIHILYLVWGWVLIALTLTADVRLHYSRSS